MFCVANAGVGAAEGAVRAGPAPQARRDVALAGEVVEGTRGAWDGASGTLHDDVGAVAVAAVGVRADEVTADAGAAAGDAVPGRIARCLVAIVPGGANLARRIRRLAGASRVRTVPALFAVSAKAGEVVSVQIIAVAALRLVDAPLAHLRLPAARLAWPADADATSRATVRLRRARGAGGAGVGRALAATHTGNNAPCALPQVARVRACRLRGHPSAIQPKSARWARRGAEAVRVLAAAVNAAIITPIVLCSRVSERHGLARAAADLPIGAPQARASAPDLPLVIA